MIINHYILMTIQCMQEVRDLDDPNKFKIEVKRIVKDEFAQLDAI